MTCGLPDETNVGFRRPPQAPGKAIPAKREPMAGEEYEVERMLSHPGRERRLGAAEENRESGSSRRRSQSLSSRAQLRLGLAAHGAVVGARSTSSAAAQRPSLRRERDDPQLAARFGQFSRLAQRCLAAAAGFEDDQDARRATCRPRTRTVVDRAAVQRGIEPAHTQPIYAADGPSLQQRQADLRSARRARIIRLPIVSPTAVASQMIAVAST